mmetsp:Transcript_8999/g.13292  ORF Transcript_8999/g.13292 Transcript_8999/m.13292 type:complete len:133 (-) Transcript_8999:1914-2312(-)
MSTREAIFNRNGQTLRGLENYIEDEFSPTSLAEGRRCNRKFVDEQKRIKEEGHDDGVDEATNRLARFYFQVTAPFVELAHSRGKSDAEALKCLENVNEADKPSNCLAVNEVSKKEKKKKKKKKPALPSYMGV